MIGQTNADEAVRALCREVVDAFEAPGAAVLSRRANRWEILASAGEGSAGRDVDPQERAVAEAAITAGGVRRLGYTGLERTRRVRIVRPGISNKFQQPTRGATFVPLKIGDRVLGVLRLDGPIGATPFREHPEHLLEAFASEAALAVQRVELAQAAAHAEALRQADEMKSALMTSISHDLKTPLAGIKTSVSSLLDAAVDWSDDDRRAFLETIDSQADRLNRVISDILDLSRIESGVMAPSIAPISVHELLASVERDTRLVTAPRNVSVSAADDCFADGDEAMLRQALINLVENAAKYSTPGLPIHLKGDCVDGRVEIYVEDEGPGIAQRDLPYVFDRFYRAEEQSRRVKGSGLGLAIVKGFVELCGGAVRVESSGMGTRFAITMPASSRERAPA
jgi:two-component system sensor histidine kinase KdpD